MSSAVDSSAVDSSDMSSAVSSAAGSSAGSGSTGAAAMGVYNILCLTGDGVDVGDHPEAKPVFDVDCMSMLSMVRGMRDDGQFLSGRKLTSPPNVFLGAAANPFAPPLDSMKSCWKIRAQSTGRLPPHH